MVKSGGGLHCYWVFTEKVTKELWLPVAFKFKTLAKEGRAPLLADPSRTADIASILRPVGTNNWKPERAGAVVTFAPYLDSDTPPPLTEADSVQRDDPAWSEAAKAFTEAKRTADSADEVLEAARRRLLDLVMNPRETGAGVNVVKLFKPGNVD